MPRVVVVGLGWVLVALGLTGYHVEVGALFAGLILIGGGASTWVASIIRSTGRPDDGGGGNRRE